jgi:copper chaperone
MITTLRVTGMTCNGCKKHVDAALRGIEGVSAVEVDLAQGQAKIVHEETASVAAMIAVVNEAGFSAATQ